MQGRALLFFSSQAQNAFLPTPQLTRGLDCAQPMGNDQGRAIFGKTVQRLLHQMLRFSVQGTAGETKV
jgi:hypothetical protein